jgi:16S rRNA G966 N2-methylase RsmD
VAKQFIYFLVAYDKETTWGRHMPKPITQNNLCYGDNLPILCEHMADESIDLIFPDPPFNSNRANGIRKQESGQGEAGYDW